MLLQDVRLDTIEVPQSLLNIETKDRSNLLTWKGQFSPQLVDTLITRYAKKGDSILDPFMGSGTVLYEAASHGMRVTGSDINPAAFILARTYTIANVSLTERINVIKKFEHDLFNILSSNVELFSENNIDTESLELLLCQQASSSNGIELMLAESLIVLSDFHRADFSHNRILKTWQKLKEMCINIPFSDFMVSANHCDSRKLPIDNRTINLTITSPPYINVFNYHQQYRKSAEALGWDLLQVAKSEVGSNRKHRGNRFLTAIQYCIDIAQTFSEVQRVSAKDARAIFVVGRESTIRGVKLLNGDIVARVVYECFKIMPTIRQEREFKNRFGQRIIEDIIHFQNFSEGYCSNIEDCARKVAIEILRESFDTAPTDVALEINAAIINADKVLPSPLFSTNSNPVYNNLATIKKEKKYDVSCAAS